MKFSVLISIIITREYISIIYYNCKWFRRPMTEQKFNTEYDIRLCALFILFDHFETEDQLFAPHICKKTFPSGRNGSIRVDALHQSHQRHPGGGLLRAQHQYDSSHCISPSDHIVAVSSHSVSIVL